MRVPIFIIALFFILNTNFIASANKNFIAFGIVLDKVSKKPLCDTKVIIYNMMINSKATVLTKCDGNFQFKLETNKKYLIYAKKGTYVSPTQEIEVLAGKEVHHLSLVLMLPSAEVSQEPIKPIVKKENIAQNTIVEAPKSIERFDYNENTNQDETKETADVLDFKPNYAAQSTDEVKATNSANLPIFLTKPIEKIKDPTPKQVSNVSPFSPSLSTSKTIEKAIKTITNNPAQLPAVSHSLVKDEGPNNENNGFLPENMDIVIEKYIESSEPVIHKSQKEVVKEQLTNVKNDYIAEKEIEQTFNASVEEHQEKKTVIEIIVEETVKSDTKQTTEEIVEEVVAAESEVIDTCQNNPACEVLTQPMSPNNGESKKADLEQLEIVETPLEELLSEPETVTEVPDTQIVIQKKIQPTSVKPKPKPAKKTVEKKIVFKVRIGAFASPLKVDSESLKPVIEDLSMDKLANGHVQYMSGGFSKYARALNHKNRLKRKGYPQSSIVVYIENKLINLPIDKALKVVERYRKNQLKATNR